MQTAENMGLIRGLITLNILSHSIKFLNQRHPWKCSYCPHVVLKHDIYRPGRQILEIRFEKVSTYLTSLVPCVVYWYLRFPPGLLGVPRSMRLVLKYKTFISNRFFGTNGFTATILNFFYEITLKVWTANVFLWLK